MDLVMYLVPAVILTAGIFAFLRCLVRQTKPIDITIEIMPTIDLPTEVISRIPEPRRQRRRPRRPRTPPPEFNSALINSTPIFYIQMDEDQPPPTYMDYLEMLKEENSINKEDLVQFYV